MSLPKVAIVGGGIAGLYCARELGGAAGASVTVFERLDRVGGRIETETADLEGFTAEFGPMRFEPELQPLFSALCDELNVTLDYFPGPGPAETPGSITEDLGREQRAAVADAFTLLKTGVLKMFDADPVPTDGNYIRHRQAWLDSLDLLPTHRPPQMETTPTGGDVLGASTRITSHQLRAHHTVPTTNLGMHGTPWRDLGFWNALSEVLSHDEILRVRDFGTFYHLIPDNPNAVEWAIFWLRIFQLGPRPLATITGASGVSTVVERLKKELEALETCVLCCGHEVVSLSPSSDSRKVMLTIRRRSSGGVRTIRREFDHVILALPRGPLKKLAPYLPRSVAGLLDSVIGFPLVKVFAVVDNAWWVDEQPPAHASDDVRSLMMAGKIPVSSHRRAGKIPTREIHYYVQPEKHLGMAMLYTDHPATEYWKTLLPMNEEHSAARICKAGKDLPALRGALAHYLNFDRDYESSQSGMRSPHRDTIAGPEITAYAIRDWAREPFGAGCHVWKPGQASWRVRDLLKAFALQGAPPRLNNIHICGEAYSEYQGFIEGALQSAMDALLTLPMPIRAAWAQG